MQTFSGIEYIKIDMANQFGLDKLNYDERIKWVDDNESELENLVTDEKTHPQYISAVMAYRKAQQGIPTGHLVGFDACASGIQIMGALTNCPVTLANTGLLDTGKRMDIYSITTREMNHLLKGVSTVNPARKDVKQAQMTHFYSSTAMPKKIFGDGVELDKFYEAQELVAEGACIAMEHFQSAWQPYAPEHEWVLPDGFHVKVRNQKEVTYEAHIPYIEARVKKITKVFEGTEKGRSISANITHSIDGMVVREMQRRCNYDPIILLGAKNIVDRELDKRGVINYVPANRDDFCSLVLAEDIYHANSADMFDTKHLLQIKELMENILVNPSFPILTVHDEFKAHPNYCNHMRQHFNNIIAELAESNIASDILAQIHGVPTYNFPKLDPRVVKKIRQANYGLS